MRYNGRRVEQWVAQRSLMPPYRPKQKKLVLSPAIVTPSAQPSLKGMVLDIYIYAAYR